MTAVVLPSTTQPIAEPSQAQRTWLCTCLGMSFFCGLLKPFTVRVVGAMPLGEIPLLLGLGIFALCLISTGNFPAPLLRTPLFWALFTAQLIGLTGYVVSDLYRDSASGDMIRGWARMIFLGADFFALAVLFGVGWAPFVALQLGLVFSVIEPLLNGPLFGDYWKFGWAFPLTTAVFLTAPLLGRVAAPAAALALGVVHFTMDFRSMTAICTAVGGLLTLAIFPRPARRVLFFTGVLVVAAGLLVMNTSTTTSQRSVRSDVERSAMMEAAWIGFTRSPWIGQGSWFSQSDVMEVFLDIRAENAHLAGIGGFENTDAGDVAIHSQLLVALAEGGLFGGTFFFLYGLLLLWTIYAVSVERDWDRLTPILVFTLVVAFIDLCISPFSGAHRLGISVAAAAMLRVAFESGERHAHANA
jgi:hypothetical protein